MSPTQPRNQLDDRPVIDASTRILGLHRVLPMAYDQIDMTDLWTDLAARIAVNEHDAAAMVDMSTILQSYSRTEEAVALLREVVKIRKDFCVVHGDGTGIRLLAFVTPGDFMANTPLDFLLNGSNAVLWFHYVDETTSEIDNLPDYDVAFFAIGEANHHGPVLARMKVLLSDLERPIMNNDPLLIARLTRDGVSDMFADEPSILAPQTCRIDRKALQAVAAGGQKLCDHDPELDFPVIVRPIGTHAGGGMECARDRDELARYLLTESSLRFYVAPFIDYSNEDGLFSKQRIVFIDGKPFASHLALSEHWMVHYLSAGMTESASKRAVEADWMESFDTEFAVRHADAFEALNRHIGLDYFGIDCAELADGRLLVFELDVAMVVHDMDDPQIFPYKKVAMQKLFDAFVGAAETRRVPKLANAA